MQAAAAVEADSVRHLPQISRNNFGEITKSEKVLGKALFTFLFVNYR